MRRKILKNLAAPKASNNNLEAFGVARFWKIFVLTVPHRI
jgi:hypothetical protein